MRMPSKLQLSSIQRRTLRGMQDFIDEFGYPPTVDELTNRLNIKKATVYGCLNKLITKGYLRKTPGIARGIDIACAPRSKVIDVVAIPLLGAVPAGIPISTDEIDGGCVYVHSSVVGKSKCFALNVVGHSMRDAEICDGDIVIVRQQPLAEAGDIVVASIDGEVTVKRLEIDDGKVRLLPENEEFDPIEVGPNTDLRILGEVIATRRLVSAD